MGTPDYSPFSLNSLRGLTPQTTAAREFTTSLSALILARLAELPSYNGVNESVAALNELGHTLVHVTVHGEGYSFVEEFDEGTRRFQIVGLKDCVSVSYHAQETEAQRLARMSETERADHQLRQQFYRRAQALWDRDYGTLPELHRLILGIDTLEREVNNGGFLQYFSNTQGRQAPDLAEALQKIGAPKTAALVQRALTVFPGPPASDWQAWAQSITKMETEHSGFLNALDSKFYQSNEDLALLTMKYVKKKENFA